MRYTVLLSIWILVGCAANPGGTEKKSARMQELYGDYKKSFAAVDDVTAETVLAWQKEDKPIVLVDVRELKERQISMIPGALSKDEFEGLRAKYKGHKIVIYCTIGYRSGLYAKELKDKGVDVYNLVGGIIAWTHAGGNLHDPSGKSTHKAHVYGRKWDLLPEAYEAIW